MKKILIFLLVTAVFLSLALPVPADETSTNYKVIVEDNAGLLTREEKSELKTIMEPLSQYGTVVFHTRKSCPASVDDTALEYLNNHVSSSRQFPCVMFMISMDPRTIYIMSRGNLERYITRSDAYAITGDIAPYASRGEYMQCAKAAFTEIDRLIREGRHYLSFHDIICTFMLSLAVALIAAYWIIRENTISLKNPIKELIKPTVKNASVEVLSKMLVSEEKEPVPPSPPPQPSFYASYRHYDPPPKKSHSSRSSCSSCGSSCSSCGSSCSSCGSGGGSSF